MDEERAAASKPVVTISSTYGAGGTVVGPAVAKRLRLPYLDRIVSSDVARRVVGRGADEELLSEDERSEGLLRRLADSLASVPSVFGSVITPLDTGVLTGEHVSERVEATIQRMAEETGGVVVGRAAVCVLRAHPTAVHVRLDGPRDRRVKQAMQIEGIDETEACRRLATIDRTRALYIKRFYDRDSNDPSLYHVVLDSTAVPLQTCVDVIVEVARARLGLAS
jgi:Cytidylate kinase-like family